LAWPQWLRETVYESKWGMHEYHWRVKVVVPAKTTITVNLMPPEGEVWLESGYEFDTDALDLMKFSHWHDGRVQYKDMLVTENALSLPYVKHELVRTVATVQLENTDELDHWIECVASYRVIPRDLFMRVYAEV